MHETFGAWGVPGAEFWIGQEANDPEQRVGVGVIQVERLEDVW